MAAVILGDPSLVHEAAATLARASEAIEAAAASLDAHGESVTAEWSGEASAAAGETVYRIKNGIYRTADAIMDCQRVYATYADELAAAQSAWQAGHDQESLGIAALRSAATAATTASDRTVDDPGRHAAVAAARTSHSTATSSVEAGGTAMTDAVAQETGANVRAATAIDAISARLGEVGETYLGPGFVGPLASEVAAGRRAYLDIENTGLAPGTSSLPGPTDPVRSTSIPQADAAARLEQERDDWGFGATPEDEAGNQHSALYNQLGGAGNGAWGATLGAVGELLAGSPYQWVRAGAVPIARWHEDLEQWYGADLDSEAYRENSEIGELITGIAVPGPGGRARALDEAQEAAAGGRVASGGRAVPRFDAAPGPMPDATLERALALELRPNNVNHIMQGKHQLGPLVQHYGSEEEVVKNMVESLGDSLPTAGRFTEVRELAGIKVLIDGRVVDGVPRIGTAYLA